MTPRPKSRTNRSSAKPLPDVHSKGKMGRNGRTMCTSPGKPCHAQSIEGHGIRPTRTSCLPSASVPVAEGVGAVPLLELAATTVRWAVSCQAADTVGETVQSRGALRKEVKQERGLPWEAGRPQGSVKNTTSPKMQKRRMISHTVCTQASWSYLFLQLSLCHNPSLRCTESQADLDHSGPFTTSHGNSANKTPKRRYIR